MYNYEMQRDVLLNWVYMVENGGDISGFFIRNNINSVVIYGMGKMGEKLYESLSNKSVDVLYGIDKNVGYLDGKIEIYKPKDLEDRLEDVEAIVVTVLGEFEKIYDEIKSKAKKDIKVFGIEDIVYDEIVVIRSRG